ncbi:unnamed protein product [Brachionus calyciflorus]|uniref:Uncharacterized protein n=1 Tax=Brachionus calyciflorus TaxID=104777 RepID=A0A814LPQ5_9BILA|nr:unnamed protein product [Brachionus calyciflorus]
MGFIGLEKIVDSLKKSSKFTNLFVKVPLSDLKFVIDGNQLVYIFLNWYQDGAYGGNYDKLYENYVNFLLNLQPYIHIVIFNGSKDNTKKAEDRSKRKIQRLINFEADENYFSYLKEFNPLFSRYILIEALNSLGIDYLMASEIEDHAIACYANGYGPSKGFFTVLSKDTYFSVYYLEKGYVSWKYVSDIFKDFNKIKDSLEVPVFYLKNLLASQELTLKSWIYLCIQLGDYDLDLNKNIKFFRAKKLDSRTSEYYKLIEFFRRNQSEFHRNNYQDIRNTYDRESLDKVDNLISLFEFKNTQIEYLESLNQTLNEFDRFIYIIRTFKKVFFTCLIENYRDESSVFEPCLDIFYLTYTLIKEKFFNKKIEIKEYFRAKNPTKDKLLNERTIKINDFDDDTDYVYKFLKNKSDMTVLNTQIDNLSLFYTALCLMTRYLKDKWIDYSTESIREAILINFMLLNLKYFDYNLNDTFDMQSNDIEIIFSFRLDDKDQKRLNELIDIYDQIKNDLSFDPNYYLDIEFKEVHFINQFQAFYFSLGVLNKISQFNLLFLSPHRILNGLFLTKFLKDKSKNGTKCFELNEMIKSMSSVLKMKNILLEKFDIFYHELELEITEMNKETLENLAEQLHNIRI